MTKDVYLVMQGLDFHNGEEVTYEPVYACDTEENALESIERLKKNDEKWPYEVVRKIETLILYTKS